MRKPPEKDALQARRRADHAKPVPADVKPRRHRRQHARAAQELGRPIGEEGGEDGEQDLDARLRDPAAHMQHRPADDDPPENLADHDDDERSRGMAKGKRAGADRDDREAVEDQRGGVVRQSLAFEDDGEAPGKLHAADDRERRHGVGRRDDGAQDEADRPGKAEEGVRRPGDRHRGEHDAAHREKRDRPKIEAKLAPAHRDGRRIDHGWQDEKQHQLGRQLQRRQSGDQRQHDAGQDEKDGRRDFRARRRKRNHRDHDKQGDQNLERRGSWADLGAGGGWTVCHAKPSGTPPLRSIIRPDSDPTPVLGPWAPGDGRAVCDQWAGAGVGAEPSLRVRMRSR